MSDSIVKFLFHSQTHPRSRTHIRTGNIRNNILRRTPQQLRNNTELIDMILAWKNRPSKQYFSKDTARAPNVDFLIVSSPGQHDLRCAVVPRRDVAGHLGLLHAGETEVADFQIAVIVD